MGHRRSATARRAELAARSQVTRRRATQALYARLPAMVCKGLCAHSCQSPIDMSDLERERIRTASGVRIPLRVNWPAATACPALDEEGRCTTYDTRPCVCRLWGLGANETMACPHGCAPADGRLSDEELIDVILTSFEIGGHPDFVHLTDRMREVAADPRLQPVLARLMSGDVSAAHQLIAAIQRQEQNSRRP